SFRRSSKSRKGSNSLVLPKPKARWSLTPAPSTVDLVSRMSLTARSDMVTSDAVFLSVQVVDARGRYSLQQVSRRRDQGTGIRDQDAGNKGTENKGSRAHGDK